MLKAVSSACPVGRLLFCRAGKALFNSAVGSSNLLGTAISSCGRVAKPRASRR